MYDITTVGDRIKFYRHQLKLTQNELAGKLNVSFQAVSSWENGATVPDIENLCRLALIYNVSVDCLLQNDRKSVMIAVDGGGTKSEFVLFTSEGEVLKRFRLGGTNVGVYGMEKVIDTLCRGINMCISERVDISTVFIGTAGSRLDEIQKRLSDYYSKFKVVVESDGVNALMSDNADAALICGTGSILILKQGDGIRKVGAWGYLLGDPGSAFNLGREALRIATGYEDGTVENDIIYKKILGRLGCESLRNTPFSREVSFVASLASVVLEAYEEKDIYAEKILCGEAKSLSTLINASCKEGTRIIACGGILEHHGEILLPILKSYVKPGIEFIIPTLPPIYGASVRCCELSGITCDGAFKTNFESSIGSQI